MHKENFMIYRRDAKKGEATYSPKSHSAPHFVGHYVEGMEEWASWYCFNKKEDGTYEAELDEAWDEGSHYGGGTIDVDIPKEWFALSYDDFLEHIITLAAAKHYGFTVDDLKETPTSYRILKKTNKTGLLRNKSGLLDSGQHSFSFVMLLSYRSHTALIPLSIHIYMSRVRETLGQD